jgi:hypothetical protein
MWSVACIIFELVTGDYLFDPPDEARNRDRAHIYQILELTNPFYDRRWAMSGRQSSRIFNTDGQCKTLLLANHVSIQCPVTDLVSPSSSSHRQSLSASQVSESAAAPRTEISTRDIRGERVGRVLIANARI